jgi:hypothetical protein
MATLIVLVDGTIPVAADFNANFNALNAEVRPANSGGTGQATYAIGDILYASAINTLSRLAAGSTGTALTMTGGVPAWGAGNAGTPGVAGLIGAVNGATPTSKYDLLASYVKLRNPTTGSLRTVVPTTLTNDIAAATTANGRDQAAAFTTSSWIYMYYVGTGSGAPTTLSSASPTGPTLLTGQSEWALASALFYDTSPKIVPTVMRGASAFYATRQAALATGNATTEASVSMTSLIPPIAMTSRLNLKAEHDAGAGSNTATVRFVTGADYFVLDCTVTDRNYSMIELPNVNQGLFYVVSTTTAIGFNIDVLGYRIANGDV